MHDNENRTASQPLSPIRLGVLISGGGTTLVNFHRQIAEGRLQATIPLVIASRRCGGVERAAAAGLRCEIIRPRDFSSVEQFSEMVFQTCREAQVQLVVLSGFLSLLNIPDDFRDRVMNIHPSLIPAFCGSGFFGHHVHEAAIQRGVKFSGCTVHFVDQEYDHGPIILQRVVPVQEDDTPDSLAARVFSAECEAYPEAIRLFAAGRLQWEGSRVRILTPR